MPCSLALLPAEASSRPDASFAEAAAALVEARAEALEDLAPRFASSAAELGLEGAATLEYAPRAAGSAEEIREGLAERREADLRLGRSSWGPHLDEVKIAAADRALRRFGSRASSGPPCSRCSSPSGPPSPRPAGSPRCCSSTMS